VIKKGKMQNGAQVKTTEHTPKTPIATTGFFAMLRGLFATKGCGAPCFSPSNGGGVLSPGLVSVAVPSQARGIFPSQAKRRVGAGKAGFLTRPALLLPSVLLTLAAIAGFSASPASAALPAAGFTVESYASPTNFSAGDSAKCVETVSLGHVCDAYEVNVVNSGSVGSDGSPVSISDVLPPGLTVQRVSLYWSGASQIGFNEGTDLERAFKELIGVDLCTVASNVLCSIPFVLAARDRLQMIVYVTASDATARPLTNTVSVSGGGAPSESSTAANAVGSSPAAFGVSNFGFGIAGADGLPDAQAGDHPYELTLTFGLNNSFRVAPDSHFGEIKKVSVEDPKNIVVDLPLGFVGSTLAAPQCTLAQLSSQQRCPEDAKVGELRADREQISATNVDSPIWNMVPDRGVPAEFGYIDVLKAAHVLYTRVVPTSAGYVLEATSPDIPQLSLSHIVVKFFGDPAERDHTGNAQVPFFTNPAICSGSPLVATVHLDSWQHPGRFRADGIPDFSDPNWASRSSSSPAPTGCNALAFSPELRAHPTTETADSPSGLDFELKLAQSELAGTHATPPLKNASVTFPEGFTLDPSSGDGLAGCSEAQIGWEGPSPFLFNPTPPACPEASKVGSLELETPLIPGVLTGEMYLANQNENPFGSVFGMYVVVQDPVTGVLIKIAGKTLTDPNTGQITGVFNENPQLPFSDLKLHFFGGPRAVFATPEGCGTFTTTSSLAPWSLEGDELPATPFDSFPIDTGCVNGFAPAFLGGSTNLQAGAYTAFEGSFTRSDIDQEIGGLSVTLPPGMSANLTGVPLCGEAQASAGTCPEASQIGTVRAGAGPGPNPLFTTGKAYLTGPYKGGAFGMSVVVPAIAGPFNFGNVVVRQSLRINPLTAQVTAVSDPFPTILTPTGADGQRVGIPIRLRRVDFAINRPGFTFNPTNCSKLQVGGSMSSTQGVNKALEDSFQVTNCANLKFTPKFAVTTSGKTSKANGASLHVKLTYPAGALGTQANIARVKVDLPKQLPSRLTTLQKACTNKQFETNPAGCPKESFIGHAKAVVPNIPVPLEGPAIFVSHGGEAFPSLIIVLQGYGVTVDLVGTTFISKSGITSTTFKTVPDAPVGSFELTLPQGKFSALAANGNICKSKLTMPTEFLAQNGAKLNQSTKVSVTGCKKAKKVTKRHKQHKGKKGRK
jgi:uncharacterized repeat protein (TIGR01451 family)